MKESRGIFIKALDYCKRNRNRISNEILASTHRDKKKNFGKKLINVEMNARILLIYFLLNSVVFLLRSLFL